MPGYLDRLKKALGLRSVPEDVGTLYAKARDEREALDLLKQARNRDEDRVGRALQDVDVLTQKEAALLAEGKGEASEARRLYLARMLKEIRGRVRDIHSRVENIYSKRLKIYNEHIASLQTIVELASEPLPDSASMEDMAVKARESLDRLDRSAATAEGIAATAPEAPISEEERAILAEFGPGEPERKALAPPEERPTLPEPKPRVRREPEQTG